VKKLPTLQQCETALGEPASAWSARCFEIASRIVDAKLCPKGSVAVYGHWIGPITKGSLFAGKAAMGFVQHGWVVLPDGRVLDPTRWVFEHVVPYLYVGAADADHYDEGGNKFRTAMQPSQPPSFDECEDQYLLDQYVLPDGKAWTFVEKLLGLSDPFDMPDGVETGTICESQLHWLAHRDPRSLGGHAKAIYDAIRKLDKGALIPIDNKMMVDRGAA